MRANELRKKHPRITLKQASYHYADSELTFSAEFLLAPDIHFRPQVTIHDVPEDRYLSLSRQTLQNYAFHLGLAELFSYWKAAASPEIAIEAGELSPDQLDFWHDLLIKGMGEYFYVNQIDFTKPGFVRLSNEFSHLDFQKNESLSTNEDSLIGELAGSLLPLGGGKDSLVSLELLKQHSQEPITLFALNPIEAVKETIKLNPELPVITASRVIDPALLELNHAGYLNGHTPFSAYLAFLSTVVARVFGLKYVVISNERSSNEESVRYLDHPINHQYSKSFELEEGFRHYARTNLPQPGPEYFSLLRPLYELQIAKIFSEQTNYFPVFKSCNRNQKLNSWCGECSKCLFAFLILYPFLDEATMTGIFGSNLLNNQTLWNTAKELIGYSHQKPLDCVGTHEESLIALYLCYQKDKQYNKQLSKLSEKFEQEVLPHEKQLTERAAKIMTAWNDQHALPKQFARIIRYVHQETFLAGK